MSTRTKWIIRILEALALAVAMFASVYFFAIGIDAIRDGHTWSPAFDLAFGTFWATTAAHEAQKKWRES